MARYIPEVYGPAEPVWVTNNRRRLLGHTVDPLYTPGAYTRGRLVPDLHLRAPIFTLEDIARIKNALSVQGVYNVICNIPDNLVIISTRLSPHLIIDLVSGAVGEATLISVVEPSDIIVPPAPFDRARFSSLSSDDMYSYPSYTGYYSGAVLYDPYNGRSYDNEFRPSRYYSYY